MLTDIALTGYRGFKQFQIPEMGRVNLIVGKNNAGKSAILEGIAALVGGDPTRLFSSLYLRGERFRDERSARSEICLDPRHLFYGHEIQKMSKISLNGHQNGEELSLNCEVVEVSLGDEDQIDFDFDNADGEELSFANPLAIELSYQGAVLPVLNLTYKNGLNLTQLRRLSSRPISRRNTESVRMISTDSLDSMQISALWSDVALTEDEARVIEAMQILEPDLERIASIGVAETRPYRQMSREGIVVKLNNSESRIPIGSMGDGMWRMLSLALSAVKSAGGVLLVDEIDTGLHYSVLDDMWKLVFETAVRLDIQVFATTHSNDCVQALASVVSSNGTGGDLAMVHRIERGAESSVSFSANEFVAANKQEIEIR